MISRATPLLARGHAIYLGLLLALAASFPTIGCDKSPLFAPTQSTIALAASRLVLPINGGADIIATVLEQGGTAPQNGTLVTFTTTLGTIEPREAHTNAGTVTVHLNAGTQSGTATVGAFSGDAVAETLDIVIGGAAAAQIVLTASPGTVPSSGGSVQLLALVSDESGNRLPGVPVAFTANAGTLSTNSVTTDQNGQARSVLTTTRETTVTATAGGQEATATIDANDAPAVTIGLPSGASQPTVGQSTDFALTVTVGSNPIRTVTVDFGDGESQSLGAVAGATTVSHVYDSAATFAVTATATDTSGDSTTVTTVITVASATAPAVTITASASPTASQPTEFTITVTPATNPVQSVTVDFGDGQTQSLGAVSGSTTVSHVYGSAGTFVVTVTATDTSSVSATATTVITVAAATAPTVTIAATGTPTADQATTFTLTVTAGTNPVQSVTINFGDGQTQSLGAAAGTTTVSHVYGSDGTFVVTVTATDTAGQGATATTVIVVQEQTPLNVTIATSIISAAPVSIQFTALVSPSTTPISRYDWNFGDGATGTTSGTITSHVYAAAATVTVTVTAVATDGTTGTGRIQIIIP